jgi:hypothetical protein
MRTGLGPIWITLGSLTPPCTPWQPTMNRTSGVMSVTFSKSFETG